MDIPFIIFALYTAIALTIGIIGIIMGIKKINGAPFITVIAGLMFLLQVILIENIIIDSNVDEITNVADFVITYNVNQDHSSYILNSANWTHLAEYFKSTSVMVSQPANEIIITLDKTGVPTGNATIGIFDSASSPNLIHEFGTLDVATMSSSKTDYIFILPSSYIFTGEERVGITYTGGTALNYVTAYVATDSVAPVGEFFDGTNSVFQASAGAGWATDNNQDMRMKLLGNQDIARYSYVDNSFAFNTYDTWVFTILLGLLFMFIGVMLQYQK